MAAAFAVWSFAVVTKPQSDVLYLWVTAGLLILFVSLLFFISAATVNMNRSQQQLALGAGAIFAILLFVVRLLYPSSPFFSPNGLFYFGQQPIVKLLTLILLAATITPVALTMAQDIRKRSELAANSFIAVCVTELLGAALLLSTTDDDFLFLVRWTMAMAFLLLVLVAAGLVDRVSPAPRRS